MSQEVQGMLIQLEATTAQLRREMASADDVVARTTRQIDRNLSNVDEAFDRAGQRAQQGASLIRGAFAAIAGAGLVGGMIKQIDSVGQMSDRMRELTGSSVEYNQVQARLLQTAKQTYRPLQEAQELYLLTADSIKGMGYNTQQALDITDSFSYLLVTNASSADKARTALDAYSKSLMTGKVGADEWRSILSAMPTVVKALADATGMSVEEIKRLGIEGKLSLDDLNKGFLNTVEANQAAAERMRASVTDALVNINTAIGVYLGRAEEGVGAADALASALGVVADNIEVVAAVVGGVAAGAMAAYTAKAAAATVETVRGIKAAIADRAARIAQADATLQAAIAEQRKAQTSVLLAAREAQAARGTAVQAQMSIQLAQARQREAAATVAVTAAQAGLRTASTGLLALLGGPMGLALLAGTAAASFLLMRDGSDDAKVSLDSLSLSVEEYGRKWAEASKEQRRALLVDAREQLGQVRQDLDAAVTEIEKAFYDRGPVAGQPFTDVINMLGELRAAAKDGAGVDGVVQSLLEGVPAGNSFRDVVEQASGRVADHASKQAILNDRIADYTVRVDDNTRSIAANNSAHAGMSKSAADYIAAIEKRTAAVRDGNDPIAQANRHIQEHGKYTEDETAAILKAAAAQKAAQDERTKATAGRKASTKSITDQISAIDALIAKYDPAAKAQKDYDAGMALAEAQYKANKISAEQYQKVVQGLYTDLNKPIWAKHNKQAEDAAKRIKAVDDAVQGVLDRLDPATAAARKYAAEQKAITDAMREHPERADEYRAALEKLRVEYEDNQRAASQWGQFTERALDSVDQAFADAWRNIDKGFSGFADGLKNAFKNLLAELAHMAITRPILMQFASALGIGGLQGQGQGGGLLGGLFGGGSSGGGSGLGGMLGMAQQLYSGYNTLTGVGPAAMAGWNSGGFMGAAQGVGSYYGGMVNSITSGLGAFFGGSAYSAATSTAIQAGLTQGAAQFGTQFAMNAGGGVAFPGAAAATGAAGTTTGVGGGMLSGMASAWPLAVLAGIWQSGKLYDQGVRPDAGDMWNTTQGSTLGKIGNVAPTLMSGFYKGLDSILEPVVGGKLAAMITGSTFHQALWGGINKKLFGGEWKTKDYGLGLSVDDGEFDAQQFEYRKKKGGLFSSSKKKTIWREIDPETAVVLQEAYDATELGVASIFESLGLSVEGGALAGLSVARKQISTKGKTEEEIQQAITEWFGGVAEAMNTELNKVFGTGLDYDLAGMQAFVGNLLGVNEVLRYLDVEMYEASVSGGKLAEALSAAAGGLDALAANSATYYSAFFSGAEKVEDSIDSITRAFAAADVELVGSRDAYRAMVEDIDLTTEAGQQMFATLMALAGQASAYYDIVEARAANAQAALMGAAGASYGLVQRSISAERDRLTREYQAAVAQQQAAAQAQASAATARANSLSDMASTSQSVVQALQSLDRSLDSALDKLLGASAEAAVIRREQSLGVLRNALTLGRSGRSLSGFEGLEDALGVAADLDQAVYGSLAEFKLEQGRTANLVAELQKVNGKQLTTEEKLLAQLQASARAAQASASSVSSGISGVSAQLQAEYDAAMAALDEELANAQLQIDALNGIDNSILSVGVAIDRMNAAIVAALNGQQGVTPGIGVNGNASTIDRLYQSILGYSANEEGQKFWQNALANGMYSYSDLVSGLRAQAGADARGKTPAFATGGAFTNSIVRRPTSFDMGLMGEAGAEGILPLANVGGKLGVHAVLDAPVLDLDMPAVSVADSRGDSMAGVVAELRSLRSEVQHLRQYAYQDTKNSGDTVSGIRELIATTKRKGVPA